MTYSPIARRTPVRTTEANLSTRDEWTVKDWEKRQWQVIGTVGVHHDSHGLCYEVTHPDGTVASYDPTEIEILDTSPNDSQKAMQLLGQPDCTNFH